MHEKHEKHGARKHDGDDENAEREAVTAADDTGLVAQQEWLHEVEIEGDGERSAP
jgi:hypothetical protein